MARASKSASFKVLRAGSASAAIVTAVVAWHAAAPDAVQTSGVRIQVSLPASLEPQRIDGRLLVMLSTDPETEPRFGITDDAATQQIFGVDVEGLAPGATAVIDAAATGYPLPSLRDVAPGTYRAQALLHRYETFRRADGHVVKLPMDRGEGQQWNRAPGNLYSTPVQVTLGKDAGIALTLDKVIAPIPAPPTTKYIRHERIRSEKLSAFWGRDMYIGAHVLVPEGFDAHPDARYPLMIDHGHFPHTFDGFREEKPDPALAPDFNARFDMRGYNRYEQQAAYDFYKEWTGPGFPRVLVIQIQHPTPFYDDSYAVNSANAGPWGDAIVEELIPHIEKTYRGIGAGWARFMYGGSTGGWEALAAQVFYPDAFNGAYAACPDPIDFRAYTVVNLYEDANAYYVEGRFKRTPRPGHRNWLGHVTTTLEDMNRRELALGSRTRSGQQWDVWEATYSPGRERRLPETHLGQGHRHDRQGRRGVLEGALRPGAHHAARLGEGARDQAGRQGQPVRRRHGQLLPEQRRLPCRDVPARHHQPVVRRRGDLRRPRRALLERRPRAPQLRVPPSLPSDVHPEGGRAHGEDRAAGCGHEELALLTPG